MSYPLLGACPRSPRRNPPDLHSETIRFLLFPVSFSRRRATFGQKDEGRAKQGGQKQVNERADLGRGNWKKRDRQGGT